MRPLRLEFEGFGTFRDRTVVDFADLDLVAFVGPTGSGKSTVIDAITFALYGSVARYDNPLLVAPIIHQLANEARVRFDFELAGTGYTAVRVVRRTKSKPGAAPRASTREARLERWEAARGEETTVLAGTVSELDEQIRSLLGLDFGQFTRTIVLPQGDFAEFLTDDPSNRQRLLRNLLDLDIYARMGGLARERASRAAQRAEAKREELDRLSGATAETLAAAESRSAELGALAGTVGDDLDRLASIEAELIDRRERVIRLDGHLAALAEVAIPDELEAADSAIAGATAARAAAEADLAAARERRDAAAAERAAIGDPVETRTLLVERTRQAELASDVAARSRELVELVSAHAEQEAAVVELTRSRDEAIEAARAARASADAAPWVAELVAGEPCPICRQVVVDVPDHDGHDELDSAGKRAEAAERRLSEATTARARLHGRLQAMEADVAEHQKALADLDARLEGVADLDDLIAMAERAAAVEAEAMAVAGVVAEAEAALAAAEAELATAMGAEDRFHADFTVQRDAVAELRPPPPEGATLIQRWRALVAWASVTASAVEAERAEVGARGKELAAAKAELMAALQERVAPFGLEPDPATIRAQVAAAEATAEAEVERLRDDLARKAELTESVEALAEEEAVNDALGRHHLAAGGFERWLLAEAVDDIVARATERLFELSNGRYSLEAAGGAFNVCDHGNADERRDVRTLSGGEIFLASLSLALALAESIAELAPVDSPRLDSIFLDEGFGTLDPETLDVLASAIEELSASGRLVAIVTHVRDLAERMPVRFEVRKGPHTSTIERTAR